MSFILDEQRDADCAGAFQRYREYIENNKGKLSDSVYSIASSGWWYDFEDRRCPHDAHLRKATFTESTDENADTVVTLTILLDSPWDGDDSILCISYRDVVGYTLNARADCFQNGHSDWRYDEFRYESNGISTHEIEWGDGASWVISFRDIEFTVYNSQSEQAAPRNR